MKSKSRRHVALATLATALLAFPGAMHAAEAPPSADATRGLAGGGRGVSLDAIFTSLDRNHDGRLSKDEATGAFAQRFAAWDADGDGFATREEVHDYRQRFGIDDSGQRTASTAPAVPRRAAASAAILQEPADWRLETMTVPPGFAADVKLTGTEEIRFAPGMFDNTFHSIRSSGTSRSTGGSMRSTPGSARNSIASLSSKRW